MKSPQTRRDHERIESSMSDCLLHVEMSEPIKPILVNKTLAMFSEKTVISILNNSVREHATINETFCS